MATHLDALHEAERAVVEAVGFMHDDNCPDTRRNVLSAYDALLALRATVCPTCGGDGIDPTYDPARGDFAGEMPCPAGCVHGRRSET